MATEFYARVIACEPVDGGFNIFVSHDDGPFKGKSVWCGFSKEPYTVGEIFERARVVDGHVISEPFPRTNAVQ